MLHLPLHGVRILDLTVVWAGPFATLLLGDLGAEVIRVESIQRADTVTRGSPWPNASMLSQPRGGYYVDRDPGERPWNRNGYFNFSARHKYSVTADLRQPEGVALFKELAQVADVVLENNRWGTLERLGIGYEAIRRVRPDSIYLSMPAYGATGPCATYRGFGANTEAAVGHTWLRGYPDADPSLTYVIFHSDAAAGASAAFAVAAAMHYRRRTGRGQFIDMSQAENMIHHLSQAWMDYAMNRRSQCSLGNRDPAMAPQGVYRCRGQDDWVAVSIRNDEEWRRLAALLGRPELGEDSRYLTVNARMERHDELDGLLRAYAKDKDKFELAERLQEARIPASPVVSFLDAHYDPHLTARGFYEPVAEPEAGVHLFPSRGFRLSETALHVRYPAPALGGQNRYVYQHLLGYGDAAFERFVESGHAGEDYNKALAEAGAA